jgi:integrase
MGFEEFEAYLKRNKKRERTIDVYIRNLTLVERFLGKSLDKSTTKKDIENYLNSISIQASNTIIIKILSLKIYFKWLYGMKKGYPDMVDFPFPRRTLNNLTSNDLLTEEEILKLINAADSLRDKAIVSLLFDSAIRIGELLGLDIEDVKLDTEIGSIDVDGKTGRRTVPISKSIPYLRDWINCHPINKGESPLFISLRHNFGGRTSDENIRSMLKTIKKRTGIKKHIFPHLFRHSRLTQLDRKQLSHTAMKYFAGWSKGSNMPSVYSHFSAQDTTEAIYSVDGVINKKVELDKKILEPVKCWNCKSLQNPSNLFCSACNSPLNEEAKAKREFMQLIFQEDVWKFLQSKMKK